jgi:hypothetical protein
MMIRYAIEQSLLIDRHSTPPIFILLSQKYKDLAGVVSLHRQEFLDNLGTEFLSRARSYDPALLHRIVPVSLADKVEMLLY